MDGELTISTGYTPRPLQAEIHENIRRFNVLVCHRRFGKTILCINELIDRAIRCELPAPRYGYLAPLYKQAKMVAWDYLKEFTVGLPGREVYESELRVDFYGNRRIRLFGADNPDAMRGIYLDGVILDEYAQMPPSVWGKVVRPALSDRKGWAIFIGTPQGHNDFHRRYLYAKTDPEWYAAMFKASQTGYVDEDELVRAAREMSEDEYAQEFECSFEAAIQGAYFGSLMAKAEEDGRICSVPYDPAVPVSTCWDLGIGDSTAIWFFQQVGKELHWIDFYVNDGEGLDHYVKVIQEKERAWGDVVWGEHLLPHDAEARELGTGQTRIETLRTLGLKNYRTVARHGIDDGINAARKEIPKSWFDGKRCLHGIEALKAYRRAYDEKKQTFMRHPMHDWSSHPADAFRIGCMGMKKAHRWEPLKYGKSGVV